MKVFMFVFDLQAQFEVCSVYGVLYVVGILLPCTLILFLL